MKTYFCFLYELNTLDMEQSVHDETFLNSCSYVPCETECCQFLFSFASRQIWFGPLSTIILSHNSYRQTNEWISTLMYTFIYVYTYFYMQFYVVLQENWKVDHAIRCQFHVEMFAIDIRVPLQYSIKFVCTAEDAFIRFRLNLMVIMKFEVQNYWAF